MSRISFVPEDVKCECDCWLSVSKKVFAALTSAYGKPYEILKDLSTNCYLSIRQNPKKDGMYTLYTVNGSYVARVSDDRQSFLLLGYHANRLADHSMAMKYGMVFYVDGNMTVSVRLKRDYDEVFDYVNGQYVAYGDYSDWDKPDCWEFVSAVTKAFETSADEESFEDEDIPLAEGLEGILLTAENYARLSHDIEVQKAMTEGRVAYIKINASDYERTDRLAYEFVVEDIKEDVFKERVRVIVEDGTEEGCRAEIASVVKDGSCYKMTLLFGEQIDVTTLPGQGWISLVPSTTVLDVQMKAINGIRNGEAPAKYMNNVLGLCHPAGFDNKNLSGVRERLLNQDLPPNASQIEAICSGIDTKDVQLVMGPPGTGKTTVILEWVKYFVKEEHKRVLVSSQNNKAVDNVLERLGAEDGMETVRVGSELKVQDNVMCYLFENRLESLRQSIIDGGNVQTAQLEEMRVWLENAADRIGMSSDEASSAWRYLECQRLTASKRKRDRQAAEKEYMVASAAVDALCDRVTVLREKVEASAVAKNKLVLFLKRWYHKSVMKELVDMEEKLRDAEDTLRNAENNRDMQYELSDAAAVRLREATDTYGRALKGFVSLYNDLSPQMPYGGGIWNLAPALAVRDDVTVDEMREMATCVKSYLSRTSFILETVRSWTEETVSQKNYSLKEVLLESVDVVGATCIGINSNKDFAGVDFDVTIIDEAGQIQVHNALVPMSVSNKLIMLGDHKQIPPSVDQDLVDACEENGVDTEMLYKSLFEIMYGKLPDANKIMLDTQYRMPAQIAEIISGWFYGGKYYSPDFKRGLPGLLPRLSVAPLVIVDTGMEKKRFETSHGGDDGESAGTTNEIEAEIAAQIVRMCPDNLWDETGVISAYKMQAELIRKKISHFIPEVQARGMAATLDSFQGQERNLIIYSFTRSTDKKPTAARIGFLNELRRLNVAMTRCKKTLVMIGDMPYLAGCRRLKKNARTGEELYEGSERQFSDFIKVMLESVKGGAGEVLSYAEFAMRAGKNE